MKRRILKTLWLLFFLFIFAMSLDYWTWDEEVDFSFFKLPSWVIYFGYLQFFLALAILIFSLEYWGKFIKKEEHKKH